MSFGTFLQGRINKRSSQVTLTCGISIGGRNVKGCVRAGKAFEVAIGTKSSHCLVLLRNIDWLISIKAIQA
jgi:hypothetical protein